ncbi:MAG: ribosome silencing factor [Sphaerospermopsis sp. SIO1G2]|nr:ribosome silencing factor [Sphaerospermopsis sp. SIO1G2]
METRELALHAARKMDQKGAEDLVVLELLDEQRLLYDYVVVATGRSERQTKTLADEVYHFCKRWSISHFPTEGDKGWHLIDCHQVICHAFTTELRDRYRIEALYPGAIQLNLSDEWDGLADPDLDR